ncbi:MAG: hypothetical protein J6333_00090, partial [Planctomycetes bacterium]|nr:hypothetical protein [Planctomycetota bacterium]
MKPPIDSLPPVPARCRSRGKIRSYILGMIYRNSGKEFMLPSSERLAKKLKVARSTVNVVLKDLRDGGYIYGINGVGTFANAWGVPPVGPRPQPVVSLLYGDGRMLLYDAFSWNMLAGVGNAVLRRDLALQTLHVSDAYSNDTILDEINEERCDCLVWFVPWERADVNKFMRYYQDSGRRLILVPYDNRDTDPAFNSVAFDYRQCGWEFGQALLAEGRHTLYYLFKDDNDDPRLAGIRAAFAAAGQPLWVRVFHRDHQQDCYGRLRARLAAGKVPSAIFAVAEHIKGVRPILDEFHVDVKSQCRLLGEAHCLDLDAFDGYAVEMPFDKLGAEVAGLAARLQGGLAAREKISVPCQLRA